MEECLFKYSRTEEHTPKMSGNRFIPETCVGGGGGARGKGGRGYVSIKLKLDAYNDGYLSHFVHSGNQFVFTLTFQYIIYERSRRAVLHS